MFEYGTWKNLSVFKDKIGFYVEEYHPKTDTIDRKYLKGWKQSVPVMKTVKGKWTSIKRKSVKRKK